MSPRLDCARLVALAALVDPSVVVLQAELHADDGAGFDQLGYAVALDGDTALIGARHDDDLGTDSGSAYVFVRARGSWSQTAKLLALDGAPGDELGSAVALDGDTAVVGAPLDDDGGSGAGSVHVLVRAGGAWTEEAKLVAADAGAGHGFGRSVAIDGDTILVGAPGHESAYVFVRSGGTWSESARLVAPSATPFQFFGTAVALDGDTAVVGAPFDADLGPGAGAAVVYARVDGAWSVATELRAADGAPGDRLGERVAIDADTILLGASGDDDGGADSGSAYVFVRDGSAWSEAARLTASDASPSLELGSAVALAGDLALVGAQGDDGAAPDQGSAYAFARVGTGWIEIGKLAAPDGSIGDRFGRSAAVSGDTLLVGSQPDSHAGPLPGFACAYVRAPAWAAFCPGDGTQGACPCGNAGAPGHGCDDARSGGGVRLDVLAHASDGLGGGTATLAGSGFPAAETPAVVLVRSAGEIAAAPFGDGLACLAPPLVRVGATQASGGGSSHAIHHGAGAGIFRYQLWYRSSPAAFCDPASAFNLSSGVAVAWP